MEVVVQLRSPEGQLDIEMVTISTVLLNAYVREVDFNTSCMISGKTGERGKPSFLWEDTFLLSSFQGATADSYVPYGHNLLQSTGHAAGVAKFGLGCTCGRNQLMQVLKDIFDESVQKGRSPFRETAFMRSYWWR